MMRRVFPVVLLVLLALHASAAGDPLPLVWDPAPRIWGLDLGVGYTGLHLLDRRTTTLWAYAGGGWENMPFWRLGDGSMVASYFDPMAGQLVGLPLPVGLDAGVDPWFQRAEAKWQLGIVQGLLGGARAGGDLLSGFLFYRGRYDAHVATGGSTATLLAASGLPDRSGILMHSLLAGLQWDDTLTTSHHLKSGFAAEASAEWGPAFLVSSIGSADFLRLNATARLFVPILDLEPSALANRLNLYLADFLALDWSTGPSVPIAIRQSFGGLSPRQGLGGAVRGLDSASLDAKLKAVNNLELRLTLPALFTPVIVPGVLVYVDAGWFRQVGEGPALAATGIVASTGAGVFLNVFDFAQLVGYLHYRLVGTNADEGRLFPGVDFTFKF